MYYSTYYNDDRTSLIRCLSFSSCSKMTMSVKTETQKTAGPQECAGCGKKIQDR